MTHYLYKCEIKQPDERIIYGFDLADLTERLNSHVLEVAGLEGFFTRAKLQNILNGRTKMPAYLKHWKLTRGHCGVNGYW